MFKTIVSIFSQFQRRAPTESQKKYKIFQNVQFEILWKDSFTIKKYAHFEIFVKDYFKKNVSKLKDYRKILSESKNSNFERFFQNKYRKTERLLKDSFLIR